MKFEFFFKLIIIIFCIEPFKGVISKYIVFSNKDIISSEGNDISIIGTTAIIQKPGIVLITGESEEGNIIIKSNSVTLYLQHLYLSSKINSPIIVSNNLKDIKIINLQNTTLNDLENKSITEECATIKIKNNNIVYFLNKGIFKLNGGCRNVIKGGYKTSIIFQQSEGEYIINSKKTAISSDNLIQFNGGKFTIKSKKGNAIQSQPDDNDTKSIGKIIINNGIFNIKCFNDAFTAKNNITIIKGTFNITTEEGFDSKTYNETQSSKGFKLTNNEEGCEIKIYSGDFNINTADDAFHSKRDMTILTGNYEINTKDDAFNAKYNLKVGIKNAPLKDLFINIKNCYEGFEAMAVTIYSGKIICKAKDDGINAAGPIKFNKTDINVPLNEEEWFKNITELKKSTKIENPWNLIKGTPRRNLPINDFNIISVYEGEINLISHLDGFDSNGHIYIHGGNITIFSQGMGYCEPLDHEGNLTLFNADILLVGSEGFLFTHKGIKKGNNLYAFYSGFIKPNRILEIRNENDEIIKKREIIDYTNYIFYSSLNLNENYHFYIFNKKDNSTTELNMTYGYPILGEDDEDKYYE